MTRKSSVVGSALASIKQNLTPKKSKPKKEREKLAKNRRRRGRDDESSSVSSSSSISSGDGSYESSCSSLSSVSGSLLSSSSSSLSEEEEESKWERSRSRKSKDHSRYRRSRSRGGGDKRRYGKRVRRRTRRRDRDKYSSGAHGYGTPKRHLESSAVSDDDAAQMVDLLMRIVPFYGKGDGHSDAVVVDTVHRLPPQALETCDIDGNTLLMIVCQSGAYDLMPVLLSKGCNINIRNRVGASCLHFACFSDTFSPDAAMALIRHGAVAEVAENEFGCTPLHWAAFSGHIELCTALCRAGAVPTTLDRSGYDPIHYANENGHLVCVKLLESFSNPKQEGAPTSLVNNASPSSVTSSSEWTRCLDHTGSSFYHNRETGESLWGDDYRKMGGGDLSATKVIPPPKYTESKDVDSDGNAVLVSSPSKHIEPDESVRDKVTTIVEETTLAPITEALVESSSNEKIEPSSEQEPSRDAPPDDKLLRPEKDSHLEQIIEDAVETSSIEDEHQPAETAQLLQQRSQIGTETKISDNIVPNSLSVSLPVSFNTSDSDVIDSNSATNLARNQSFEERISSLHQKMESQLMQRLQSLEDKIAQQSLKASSKVENDTSNNLAEMTSKILRLQTEQGAKDLEILSLKQQVVRLETDIIKQEKTCMHVGVGDGNIHDDELLVAAKANYDQQLKNARKEITRLKEQVDEEKKALNVVNGQLEQSQANCERAKQMARDEKASRVSMKDLLEEAQKDKGDVDAAMTLSLQDELRRAEETVVQMKEQMQSIESKAIEEKCNTRQELETLMLRTKELERDLEVQAAAHKSSFEKLKNQHKSELSRHKEELNNVNSELVTLRDQLREAKMARMKAVVARDDAVNESSLALEKARAAQTKLQEMTDFVNKATKLKESNERLHVSLQDETEKRKKLHNTLEDIKGRIRVYVRVRPLSESELKANYQVVMTKEDDRTCVMASDAATASDVRDWEFDKIFSGSAAEGNTQEAIFKDTSLLITSAIDGFNVCIFAYGQTGSGKTYTMLGSGAAEHQGLAPRVAHELFKKCTEKESTHHIEVTTSMLELYTDKLRDLLKDENECSVGDLKIKLAEHTESGLVEVDGAKIERVANAEELLGVFDRASLGRASSSTKMNADSSRSHMIATIVLSLRNRRTGKIVHGKLTLVDLAGSERVSKSGASGQQLKEAQSINKSLSALGDVIGALTSGGRQHIPYRNHPLTMLMSDSIGGNAKTLMFVCCSPADYNRRESANSLDFAKRCRNVTNNAVTSKGSSANHVSQIRALRAELSRVKKEKGGGGVGAKRLPVMRRPGM